MALGLRFGPLGKNAAHLCVDMQGIFSGDSPWSMPWFERVLPNICSLVEHQPAHTVFTRFIPARTSRDAGGSWARYYARWASMTLDNISAEMLDLAPQLKRHVPPAFVVDKHVYSPWHSSELHDRLNSAGVDALLISGGETDVCVLATVLGAIDLGYRTIIVTDAVCSSSDAAHDAMQEFYAARLSLQVETATTQEIFDNW